jgi:hypothetical protein
MLEKVFVLKKTRPYKRTVRIFMKNRLQKITSVNCLFTTQHLVSEQERQTNAKTQQAEFSTSDMALYEAMLCDSSYGKDFYLKGDPEGKLKRPTLMLTRADIDYAALSQLCVNAGVSFRPGISYDELMSMYSTHMRAIGGKGMEVSPPAPVQYQQSNPLQEIMDQKSQARSNYENKYGESVPDVVANDIAFLDAMLNIDFDAEKYIASKLEREAGRPEETVAQKPEEESFEVLDVRYMEKFKTHIPNNKKSDLAWVKNKLNS